MANVVDVVARLRADHSDYMRKMREAGRQAEIFEGQTSRAGTSMRRSFAFGARGVTVLGSAMVTAAGAIGGFGLKTAMANEQAEIAFKVMLGSAEKAKAYLQELSDFAAKTPFELPDLRSAASKLMSTGVEAKRVIPIMRALGDATSAKGMGSEAIGRAVYALQQMSTAGRATGQDMMQLTQSGIPVWESLAYSLGKSIPEIKKLGEAGKISVEDVMSAIESYSGPGLQRAKGMMDEQSKTLVGMISTLKDTISQQLGTFMQPVVGAIKGQLPALTTAIGGALEGIGPSIQAMMTALIPAITGLVPLIQPMILAFANLFTNVVQGGIPLMLTLGQILTQLGPTLSSVGTIVGDVMKILTPFVMAFAGFALVVLPPLVSALGFVTGFLSSMSGLLSGLTPVLMGVVAAVTAYVVITKAMAAWTAITAAAQTVWAAVQILAMGATSGLTGAMTALNVVFGLNPFVLVIASIVGLIAVVIILWKKFDWFSRGIKGIWNTIVSTVQVAINLLLGYWEFWINTFIEGVNLIIKGWNKIPFHKDIKPLDKVNLQLDITAAKVKQVDKNMKKLLKTASAADFRKFEGFNAGKGTTPKVNTLLPGGGGDGSGEDPLKKLADSLKKLATDKLKKAGDLLLDFKKKADDFALGVKNAILDVYSFSDALQKSVDSQTAYKDAAAKVVDTEKAMAKALASQDITAYTEALRDNATAMTEMNDASGKQVTFLQSLEKQAQAAKDFAVLLNRLKAAKLNQAGINQIVAAGAVAGGIMATELLNGGTDAIAKANSWYDDLAVIAKDTATGLKDEFYKNGITAGEALVKGIKEAVAALNLKLSSKGLTKAQIEKLKTNFGVDVGFKMEALKGLSVPAMAKGGIVKASAGGTMALLGEGGRNEAVIPLPANGLGGTVNQYSITVQTGVGDPQEIGRQLVQLLQTYEKRSGRIPIRTL